MRVPIYRIGTPGPIGYVDEQGVYHPWEPAQATLAHKPDESIPGGRFLVNGRLVNSENQRIHEDGSLLSADELLKEELPPEPSYEEMLVPYPEQ